MAKRFVAIRFLHLTTDWLARRRPELRAIPFCFATKERGRMIVKAASALAQDKGICAGMAIADCKAIQPDIQVFDEKPGLEQKLLKAWAEWCIRYTPVVAIDLPDGLILDASGCAHLWKGEHNYLNEIIKRCEGLGYKVSAAIADTVGAAWAVSRYGKSGSVVQTGAQVQDLSALPPAALRLEAATVERLEKLGLVHIRSFLNMPRSVLRRRFGQLILTRLDQALGQETEAIHPVCPIEPYQERLPALEPIKTATGIEIALKQLLEKLCLRFAKEGKGLRACIFQCHRIDGNIQQIKIGTARPSRNVSHLFKLFEIKMPDIEPNLGIELFILTATQVEEMAFEQERMWDAAINNDQKIVAELIDRLANKIDADAIHRYLPAAHHWPERSFKAALSFNEKPLIAWRKDRPRPIHLLPVPERVDVTVPIPDYPPMLFKYKGKLHKVIKADGPERIEQEWWIQKGLFRDYYCVEDEDGARYWIFRAGAYENNQPEWFVHGFFA